MWGASAGVHFRLAALYTIYNWPAESITTLQKVLYADYTAMFATESSIFKVRAKLSTDMVVQQQTDVKHCNNEMHVQAKNFSRLLSS